MKHLTLLLFFALSLTNIQKIYPKGKNDCLFCPGTTLVYDVDYFGEEYLFIARMVKNSSKECVFKYLFSNSGNQGKIVMNADAIKNATKMFNYFNTGDEILDDKTLSIIISKSSFDSLKNQNYANLDPGSGYEKFEYDSIEGKSYFPVAVDSKYGDIGALSCFTIKNNVNGDEITILDDRGNPIIINMKFDWTIRLVAIL